MMNFASEMMIFELKMMKSVLEMMDLYSNSTVTESIEDDSAPDSSNNCELKDP